MTVLAPTTKAARMREAFGKLAGEYITEGKTKQSGAIQKVAETLNESPESLARLFDIITGQP